MNARTDTETSTKIKPGLGMEMNRLMKRSVVCVIPTAKIIVLNSLAVPIIPTTAKVADKE